MSLINNILAEEAAKQKALAEFQERENRKANIIRGLMADIRGPMWAMGEFETCLNSGEICNLDGEVLSVTVRFHPKDERLEIYWREINSNYSRNAVLRKLNGKTHLDHVTPSTKDECIHVLEQLLAD